MAPPGRACRPGSVHSTTHQGPARFGRPRRTRGGSPAVRHAIRRRRPPPRRCTVQGGQDAVVRGADGRERGPHFAYRAGPVGGGAQPATYGRV